MSEIRIVPWGDWKEFRLVLSDEELNDLELDSNASELGSLIIKTVARMEQEIDNEITSNPTLERTTKEALEFDVSLIVLVSIPALHVDKEGC